MNKPGKILVAVQHDGPYSEAFKADGWEVLLADDAHRLYSLARHNQPAGILLDTHLPRGGAETALSWLRASVHTAAIPVIVLGDGDEAAMQALRVAGAQQCLPLTAKPAQVCTLMRQSVAEPPAPTEAPQAAVGDAARLAALRASGLLGTPSNEAYDKLTRLAARLLGAPIAALSLIDRNRQFHKSRVGIADTDPREVPLSESFCQWVVSGKESVVVEDSRLHPVLKHNAAVRHMGVTSYAGIPVSTIGGQLLGAFCVVDVRPRHWTAAQLDVLTDLTRLAEVLVARAMLAQTATPALADLKWYAAAGSEAILGAVRILRRDDLTQVDRLALLDEIDSGVRSLTQIRAAARGG